MKRSLDHEQVITRKRLKHTLKLPPVEKNYFPYAFSHPYDILVTNKNCEFQAHRCILCVISPVFKDMLEADTETTELPLGDIPDWIMTILEKHIYTLDKGPFFSLPDVMCALTVEDVFTFFEFLIKYNIYNDEWSCHASCILKSFEYRSDLKPLSFDQCKWALTMHEALEETDIPFPVAKPLKDYDEKEEGPWPSEKQMRIQHSSEALFGVAMRGPILFFESHDWDQHISAMKGLLHGMYVMSQGFPHYDSHRGRLRKIIQNSAFMKWMKIEYHTKKYMNDLVYKSEFWHDRNEEFHWFRDLMNIHPCAFGQARHRTRRSKHI